MKSGFTDAKYIPIVRQQQVDRPLFEVNVVTALQVVIQPCWPTIRRKTITSLSIEPDTSTSNVIISQLARSTKG